MPLVLVGIGLLLTAFVAYATAQQGHAWADAIVNWFTGWLIKLPLIGESIASLIAKGATWISNRLGNLFIGLERPVVNWIGAIGQYVRYVSDATLDAPIKLLEAVRWLVASEIPYLIHALPNSVTKVVHAIEKEFAAARADIAWLSESFFRRVRKLSAAVLLGFFGPYLASIRYFAHVWHRISHAAAYAGGIAVPWIEVPRLRREERAIAKRLGKVETLLGVTALAGVMAGVLGVSRSCLTRGNVGRVARKLCGLNAQAIEDLLGIIADVVLIADVCAVTRLLNEAVSLIEQPITDFVTVFEGALCHGDFSAPPTTPALSLSLPPVTGVSLSLV